MSLATAGFLKQTGKNLKSKVIGGKSKGTTAQPAAAPDPNALISKALSATKGPISIVVRLDTNAVLAMSPVGRNGSYVTWGSAPGQGVTYQRGVLANTRGLGSDLMASRIDRAVMAITSGSDADYTRKHYYLGDLGQTTELTLRCSLRRSGSEKVIVGEINADAVIMKEKCRKGQISFTNVYWVDSSGNILKSSQWVGQRIGSLAIQSLRL
ncbi:Group 4 capsule polysaccharide lipoprotein gfcB, YjbF [Aliiroseovarius halocynthiae]|uniref:YjbF family lipoprotein n=1 Tax=Aliiroseovarius halocynthiae TaxID=985055 RepID=A0A545SN99_9RHOB|nr:YjbF family lipoprotein [Aliiroseovarius halocynthiae]TQV66445.1 YjbF family lipoprotein [Aliiroseovarius halocynthiae]SMR83592.1 Group 4 capsule polysaccharide lipoprotein gfcB, YjbF [Aliiroseovarius halocynthiae]